MLPILLPYPFYCRGCRRYAALNVLQVFGASTDVYAVARRGLCLVLGNDYVTTSRGNTAAFFCLPRSLTQHTPFCPSPSSPLLRVLRWECTLSGDGAVVGAFVPLAPRVAGLLSLIGPRCSVGRRRTGRMGRTPSSSARAGIRPNGPRRRSLFSRGKHCLLYTSPSPRDS